MLSTNRTFKYFKKHQELFPWSCNKGRLSACLFLVSTACTELVNEVAQAHSPVSPTATAQEYAKQIPYGLCACKTTASEQQPRPASHKVLWQDEQRKGSVLVLTLVMIHSDIKKKIHQIWFSKYKDCHPEVKHFLNFQPSEIIPFLYWNWKWNNKEQGLWLV